MPNYSKNVIILVRYPFSDLSNAKVRPAVIVNVPHSSQDIMIVPLTGASQFCNEYKYLGQRKGKKMDNFKKWKQEV